jgi:hypothetical protein
MACRQRNDLFAPAVEERIGQDQRGVDSLLGKERKGSAEIGLVGSAGDAQLQPESARRRAG